MFGNWMSKVFQRKERFNLSFMQPASDKYQTEIVSFKNQAGKQKPVLSQNRLKPKNVMKKKYLH